MSVIADINPFYRILDGVRSAIISGSVNINLELSVLLMNLIAIVIAFRWLRLIRYQMPFWV